MWESPIQMITENIARDIISKTDEILVEYVHNVGINVNEEELVKALAYDRHQYEKGYADGGADREAEIVRCRDCKHYMQSMCPITATWTTDEDYCSFGERSEDEHWAD